MKKSERHDDERVSRRDLLKKITALTKLVATTHAKEIKLMGLLQDGITALETEVASMFTRVTEHVAASKAEIERLQKLVAEGGATPEDLARLEALRAQVATVDPNDPTTVTAANARNRTTQR